MTDPADTIASAVSGKAVKSAGLRYVPGNGTLCDEPDKMIKRKANNVSQIVGTLYNGQAVPSVFYYCRCMLNDNGRSAYDTIHAGLLTGASTIKMSTPLSTSEVDIVYYSVLYDDPQKVWAGPGSFFEKASMFREKIRTYFPVEMICHCFVYFICRLTFVTILDIMD